MTNLEDIRCPNCNKLICKKEKEAETKGIHFWCSRCKKEFEIKKESSK